ncbi:amidase [Uniformispora flossi]|uniref:amidase n=1 Tax=Uniformispora flossi TaxID=3390723 RepID=UPI003C300BF0
MGDLSDRLAFADATEQAALVASGEASPAELVDAAVARIERLDPALGALVAERFDEARAEAGGELPDGPFRGVPFLLKDAVQHSAGDRYQHGMTFLRDNPWVSPEDSELTRRYRAAGLVLLGRTKVPEFTISPTTEPLAHGPSRNPWDPERSPGGSSGGSAVAVASGMVPVAHANDMGGSIRIPASCCGLVGLKPTRGRTSPAPHGLYWGPLTHEHVVTRTVRDSAAVLDATAGAAPGDLYGAPAPARPWTDELTAAPGRLRIAVLTERPSGRPVDPECAAAARATGELLAELGHHVEEIAAAPLADEAGALAMGTVTSVGLAHDADVWERRIGKPVDGLEPFPALAVERGRATSGPAYVAAIEALAAWSRRIAAVCAPYDLVLAPTMAILPPPLGTLSGDRPIQETLPGWSAMAEIATLFDISGAPAISLPLHRTADGLPVGVQIAAAVGREDLLFRVAAQLEEARPWREFVPRVHASRSV